MLTATELGDYIDTRATRSIFRLELLDHYEVASDGGDFARYLKGDAAPMAERKRPWLAKLAAEREAGIRRQRVHVLSTPLTAYLRYECEWGYVPNAAAGEEILIIDTTEVDQPDGLVDHDFWLIDDSHAITMRYDESSRFVGAEPVDEPDRYRCARDAAVAMAEPFASWWARHPEEWRDQHPV
ncbi:hypothetical protein CLV63_112213 [Murinocardiopsis flavida]|uniref:DUF6879 domain-containing protein n=1 Tax=Murinocardiopsis flavida TaxID=645275 RepID=A0A2P8DGK0_9ACTN|nr:DUF6879 family protein [Murinocardiopsis flavida]PSK96328.1 hypothetical protein CLV63_112213 [Murinocardiopsis flavida]